MYSLINNVAADQVTNILKATGQNVDAKEVNAVVEKLKGKKLEDVNSSI